MCWCISRLNQNFSNIRLMTVNWMYLSEFWSHKNGSPLCTELMMRGLIWDYLWRENRRRCFTKIIELMKMSVLFQKPLVLLEWQARHQRGSRCARAGQVSGYYGVAMQGKDYIRWIAVGNSNQSSQRLTQSNNHKGSYRDDNRDIAYSGRVY